MKAYLCLDYLRQLKIEDTVEHSLPAQQFLSHLATGIVTTGSPHSQNGSQTTGLGLSLEAGPSVTGV